VKKSLIIFFCIITTSAFAWIANNENAILTEEDWQYTEEDNQHPAITKPETGEKYFNEWHCFKTNDIKITLVEIDYNGIKQSPTIYTSIDGKFVEYAIDPDINWDTDKVIAHWNDLIENDLDVCIFGVYLQETLDGELRYIERIKTHNGTWQRGDDNFILNEE
jgi:hypothetical protein